MRQTKPSDENDSRRESETQGLGWLDDIDMQPYEGKWIAILDNRIVGADDDVKRLVERVEEEHGRNPLILWIPDEPEIMTVTG